MPPKSAPVNTSRRKGPQFNPPRPVKEAAEPATSKRAPPATSKKSNATTTRPGFQPAATIISSDDDEENLEDEDLEDDEQDDLNSDDSLHDAPRRPQASQSSLPPVPGPLLARLLHENFDNKGTQIQKGAMELVGSYVDIFVREAFARTRLERDSAVKKGGIADGFLQVEDLERVAAQLVLDF